MGHRAMGRARAPWRQRLSAVWFLILFPLTASAGPQAMLVADSTLGPLQQPEQKSHTALKVDASMRKQIWGDHDGRLYYSLHSQHLILRIDGRGTPTAIAGTGKPGRSGDGSPAKKAQLRNPGALWGTRDGELFLLDGEDTLLRKIDEQGVISTVRAFNWTAQAPISAMWGDTSGNLWLSDRAKNQILRLKADGTGPVETVAGNGKLASTGDGGPALKASIAVPNGLWGDVSGNIYFAEMGNHKIRMISSNHTITTVAGSRSRGFAGDGGKAVDAKLDCPCDVWGDGYGALYIADMDNHRVRKVDDAGIISTYAGSGVPGFGGDGGPAVEASLHAPKGVWVDRTGQVYISDTFNHKIRKVDAHGSISSFGHVRVQGSSHLQPWSRQLQLGFAKTTGHLIADTSRHIVVRVSKNATTLRFADQSDEHHRGLTVKHPQSICGSENAVFIVDSGNKVVLGVDVKSGYTWALGAGRLQNPAGCAATRDWLFVTDRGSHAIMGVNRSTGHIVLIAGGGSRGCTGNKLSCPYGIALMPNATAMVTDPCCPQAFLKSVSLKNGTIKRVAAREKGTAEDMASLAVSGGRVWVAGNNDCGLEVADEIKGESHAVELVGPRGKPGALECVLGIYAPPAPPARVHLLGLTHAGEVALVHASVPLLRIQSPARNRHWKSDEQLVVSWESAKLWGTVQVLLLGAKGSMVLTLGEADVAKGTMSVSRKLLPVADGSYSLLLRSKRWPLVRSFGGPVIIGTETSTQAHSSWRSKAVWALLGSCAVGGLVSVPLCFLRVSLKDYGRLGGAIHYRPRSIFGGGPGIAGGREMDAIAEQSPVWLGRSSEGVDQQ